MPQEGRTEDMVSGRRGDTGERVEGLSGLRKTSRNGHLIQMPWAGLYGGVQKLDVGGSQPSEGAEELGMAS